MVADIQEGEIMCDFYRGESWAVGNLRVKSPSEDGFSTDGVHAVC